MKVTPLEIRQKTFEKKLRGYDKDEVHAYLQSLSQEWERLIEEQKDLRMRLENAEKDVARLREVEASLFKTLKTAEDTGANMIDQATKTAELQVKEAQMQAEAILNDAKTQAKNMIEEAEERVKDNLENAKDQLRALEADCKVIDNYRDNLLIELKGVATDTLNKVEKLQEKKAILPEMESNTTESDASTTLSFDDIQQEDTPEEETTTLSSNTISFEIEHTNRLIDEDTVERINQEADLSSSTFTPTPSVEEEPQPEEPVAEPAIEPEQEVVAFEYKKEQEEITDAPEEEPTIEEKPEQDISATEPPSPKNDDSSFDDNDQKSFFDQI